jgi:hypothetical protein
MESNHRELLKAVRSSHYAELIFKGITNGEINKVLMGEGKYHLPEPSAMTAQSSASVFQCLESYVLFDDTEPCITEPLLKLLEIGGREEVMQVLAYIHHAALIKSKRALLFDIDLQKIVSEFNHHGYSCKDYWPESAVINVNVLLAASGVDILGA